MIIKANKPSCMNRLENTKNKLYFNVVYISPCVSCEVTCLEYHSSNFFFKKLLRKITMSLEILLQMEIWTWKKLAEGGGGK